MPHYTNTQKKQHAYELKKAKMQYDHSFSTNIVNQLDFSNHPYLCILFAVIIVENLVVHVNADRRVLSKNAEVPNRVQNGSHANNTTTTAPFKHREITLPTTTRSQNLDRLPSYISNDSPVHAKNHRQPTSRKLLQMDENDNSQSLQNNEEHQIFIADDETYHLLDRAFKNTKAPREAQFNCIWAIQQTLLKHPWTKKYIEFVLLNFELSIDFANRNDLKEHTNNDGAYYPKIKTFIFTIGTSPEQAIELIKHEFRHIYFHAIHSILESSIIRKKHQICSEYAFTSPYYPYNLTERKNYEDLLKKGDDRIEDFSQLKDKNRADFPLTQTERARLHKYNISIKNTPRRNLDIRLSETEKKEIREKNYKIGNKYILKNSGVITTITSIELDSSLLRATIDDVELSFIANCRQIRQEARYSDLEEKCTNKSYLEDSYLSERDAYLYQYISMDALEVFFPEVVEYHHQIHLKAEEKFNQKIYKMKI